MLNLIKIEHETEINIEQGLLISGRAYDYNENAFVWSYTRQFYEFLHLLYQIE